MALIAVLFLVYITAVDSTNDAKFDCSIVPLILCSSECYPICAGNKTHQETFINDCLYNVEYCTRKLNESNYRIIDGKNACPIDCSYLTKCLTTSNPICVKSADKKYSETFTNYCIFRSKYCNSDNGISKKLGTQYCINQGKCSRQSN